MIDSVEGICHVKFYNHTSFLSIDAAMDCFLNQDDIVRYLSFRNETSLAL